jgi:hypothetical protein
VDHRLQDDAGDGVAGHICASACLSRGWVPARWVCSRMRFGDYWSRLRRSRCHAALNDERSPKLP